MEEIIDIGIPGPIEESIRDNIRRFLVLGTSWVDGGDGEMMFTLDNII